ncbi:MAG: ArsR family transcriptional regulator [Thermoplasmata archaeon]|uniref:ArsR family transcriptional regulator n=1 Tax=Candidatus Sysuiplasma superficiale TaxID=2823368 RepID=A0A8J8CAW4_9ARCH|nr:ArsR family transcriptional regulator [Candidatus Sysuiplasma superficiale]MBX8643358.1 ArsR family transcriptional regulator [Candidatus Sysuiplasma superficiale]MCL4347213.1 ArsR family transcriptional regulator [Candidatus Thermoplasmatota archaeon]
MDEILELQTRKRIYDEVCNFPGLHLRELSRQLNESVPLIDYHLNFLEKHGIVTAINDGQFKRYYPRDPVGSGIKTDTLSAEEKRMVALLRQKIPLQIILFLLKNGSAQHKDMLPMMNVSASTLSHHLNKLVRRGIVTKTESGKERGYRLANETQMARLLLHYQPPPGTIVDSFIEIWEELRQ